MVLSLAGPTIAAISAAFLASVVEAVEAFTIVLAVGTIHGWRPALVGTVAGVAVLALMVISFGPAIGQIPLQGLQVVIGVLLLLFGLRWLRKAILRSAGIVGLHDETAIFAAASGKLETQRCAVSGRWVAGATAFKAVLLEGLEVVFIVIAVGVSNGLLLPASLGAAAACGLVLMIGASLHRPLARVPENLLKFGVGVMLSAFGVFWTGEGLGVAWPDSDWALLAFILLFCSVGILAVPLAQRAATVEVAR